MFNRKKKNDDKVKQPLLEEFHSKALNLQIKLSKFIEQMESTGFYELQEILNNIKQINQFRDQIIELDYIKDSKTVQMLETLSDRLERYKDDLNKKNGLIKNIDSFDKSLQNFDRELQSIAKLIPKITTEMELEGFNIRLNEINEKLSSFSFPDEEFFKKYLNKNEQLKLDIFKGRNSTVTKKILPLKRNLRKKKEEVLVADRELEVSEERKRLFNWIDTFELRSRKFQTKIEDLLDELEGLEKITQFEEFRIKLNEIKKDLDILHPPLFKTPEMIKQVEKLASKYKETLSNFEKQFNSLYESIDNRILTVISDGRADRLIRKFLSTKRIPLSVFIELIRGDESFTQQWLEELPEVEPLRLQEKLVALSMSRVQEGKQLYEYLADAMAGYTTKEKEEENLYTNTLNRFKELEGFGKE